MGVKKGGKKAVLPPVGGFVVVVVVVADKDCGTPSYPPPKRQGRQKTGEGGADTLRTSPLEAVSANW